MNAFVSHLSFEQPNNDGYTSFNFTPGKIGEFKDNEAKVPSKPDVWPFITGCNEGGDTEKVEAS
jgi:hypothetical protein